MKSVEIKMLSQNTAPPQKQGSQQGSGCTNWGSLANPDAIQNPFIRCFLKCSIRLPSDIGPTCPLANDLNWRHALKQCKGTTQCFQPDLSSSFLFQSLRSCATRLLSYSYCQPSIAETNSWLSVSIAAVDTTILSRFIFARTPLLQSLVAKNVETTVPV